MAEDKDNQDEPSIEEILSSIRDIISEDDDAEGGDAEVAAAEAETEEKVTEAVAEGDDDDDDDDVIELTDRVDAEEPAEPSEDEFSESVEESADMSVDDIDALMDAEDAEEQDKDPLDGIDFDHPSDDEVDVVDTMPADEDDKDGIDEIFSMDVNETENEQDTMAATSEAEALIDSIAETATVGAMAKLAENIAVSRQTTGVTLEDIVRDLMRPMLKEWLDANLPDIIERVVGKELERLAEKAVRK